MKRILVCLLVLASLCHGGVRKPKLVVLVVVDQFRYDYLTRYRADYTGGFSRLLTRGAVFTNARYNHVPAITAVGHSTILSGAIPSVSGIVANDWFDPDEYAKVTSVSDPQTKLVGGKDAIGSSPHRLLVTTIGDEMKMAGTGKPKVVGVSLKDRSAILPGGHTADAAYWFDTTTGNFVSSTYYMKELPGWARDFNASRSADKLKGTTWMGHKLSDDPAKLYVDLEKTTNGNDLVEAFAERALAAEQLGRHEGTDLFTVSFSSNDYVGHEYGPESPEAREISIQTDRLAGKALSSRSTGRWVRTNVLVVLTADHGAPHRCRKRIWRGSMPGGRIYRRRFVTDRAGRPESNDMGRANGSWGNCGPGVYLNRRLIGRRSWTVPRCRPEAARALEALPHIFRVYTLDAVAAARP